MEAQSRGILSPEASPTMPTLAPISSRDPARRLLPQSGSLDQVNLRAPTSTLNDAEARGIRDTTFETDRRQSWSGQWVSEPNAPQARMPPPSAAANLTLPGARIVFTTYSDISSRYQPQSEQIAYIHPAHQLPPQVAYNGEQLLAQYSRSGLQWTERPPRQQQPHANPYVSQHNLPPRPTSPPPLLHKVYRLSCRSCSTFLTNRGMRASHFVSNNAPTSRSQGINRPFFSLDLTFTYIQPTRFPRTLAPRLRQAYRNLDQTTLLYNEHAIV